MFEAKTNCDAQFANAANLVLKTREFLKIFRAYKNVFSVAAPLKLTVPCWQNKDIISLQCFVSKIFDVNNQKFYC